MRKLAPPIVLAAVLADHEADLRQSPSLAALTLAGAAVNTAGGSRSLAAARRGRNLESDDSTFEEHQNTGDALLRVVQRRSRSRCERQRGRLQLLKRRYGATVIGK
jgi:hypothetical protein